MYILRIFLVMLFVAKTNYACVGNPTVEKAVGMSPTVIHNCYTWFANNPFEGAFWLGACAVLLGIGCFRGGAFTPILATFKTPNIYFPQEPSPNIGSTCEVKPLIIPKTQKSTLMPEAVVPIWKENDLYLLDVVGVPQNTPMFPHLVRNFCIEQGMLEYFTLISKNPIEDDAPLFDGAVTFISERYPNIPLQEITQVVQEICERLA